MKKIFFSFRIDCEATQSSVQNPSLGERSICGLREIFAQEGIQGTFYVLPSDLKVHVSIYRELEKLGHEVGLHLHPTELGYQEFCGIYGYEDQLRIIREATDRFTQILGRHPQSFCMGYGSCNDHTFLVLAELGYTHGHCSVPTRILPECASVWAGAPLDIHYAHASNRLLSGNLNFVEIPSTIDPDSRHWGGKHPQDLRVELLDAKNHWYTIDKAVKRQILARIPVSYIQASTHNTFDYSDPKNFRRETALGIIQAARQIAEAHDLKLVSATTAEMAAEYRRKIPRLSKEPEFRLDTRGRKALKT